MAHTTGSTNIRQKAHDGVDRVLDSTDRLTASGKDAVDRVKEKTLMLKEDVDGYIRKNPEKSVLIAVGIGAVVGAILAGTMLRRRNRAA